MIAALAGGPATLQLLPGVAHLPQREQPDEVVRRVAAFLA
jgi:pimeloyl-ACP methyl ester carboxylesterase